MASSIRPYFPASTERARGRAKFDEMVRRKQQEQDEENERRKQEEEEKEREASREFRKQLKFKARPMPNFYSKARKPIKKGSIEAAVEEALR